MVHGVDTTLLVEVEATQSAGHREATLRLRTVIRKQGRPALAPRVVAESIRHVTEPARFRRRLDAAGAIARAKAWWTAAEMRQAYPNEARIRLFMDWMHPHRLGWRRILDTKLAATYFADGVTDITTSNARGYAVFGALEVHSPA